MGVQYLTFVFVGVSFFLYLGIAFWAKASSTNDFYIAGGQVSSIANGMATASGWMSAASFISMAGIISFIGRDGSVYLMGWTGGYVLLALLLAPYLRKFGKYTVPDFVGDRYYSNFARILSVVCVIFVSFTYVAGQMRGVGIVFSRFLEVQINTGVLIGMVIVFFYSVLGGMKGITYTQVAQYCVMIFAFLVPAIFISILMTGNPIPQLGFGSTMADGSGIYLLDKLDQLSLEFGFEEYTSGKKSTIDVAFITAALMIGTAGLPHVIVRFFTVPKVRDARISAGYALFFIALLYTTAPAIASFSRVNLFTTVENIDYKATPLWFKNWEKTDLIAWVDKNDDGKIQYSSGQVFDGKPKFLKERGLKGERKISNPVHNSANELYIDRDIMVLANPEIAGLPNWVIALVAAGGLAAALSTAAGLLLSISTSVSHDILKKIAFKGITDKQELLFARLSAAVSVFIAGYFGIHPPGFVAQVVAFAFGLAASSLFPVILLGIFSKRMNKEGAIAGMITGFLFTASYIIYFKFINPLANDSAHWWFGISPEGIGTLGMAVNFITAIIISRITPTPPSEVINMVERIRTP